MKTILVSGASGIVGYGILKSLRKSGKYRLVGITIYNDSIAPAFCDIFEKVPKTNDPQYIESLYSIILKHDVNMIIPGIEADMIAWNKNRDVLSRSGVFVLLNNPELIELCCDKWHFYLKLCDFDSKFAIETRNEGTFKEFEKDLGLPFLLKPRCGYASKGIIKVENNEVFEENKHKLGCELMAQPIIGNEDQEYTISAFFDNNSNLLCSMGLKRKLSKEGYTEIAEVIFIENVDEVIKELAEIFKPVGPTNFQFRMKEGNLKLLEINPRISSSTSIRAEFGYNESIMAAEYFIEGVSPLMPQIRKGKAIRYIEEHIFYDSYNI